MDILWPWGTGVGIGTISGAVLMRYCPRASPIVLRKALTVSSLSTAYLSVSVWFTTFSRISGSTCAESRHTCSALLSSHNRIQANNGPPLPPYSFRSQYLSLGSNLTAKNWWWTATIITDDWDSCRWQCYWFFRPIVMITSKNCSIAGFDFPKMSQWFLRVNWKNAL